MAKFYVIMKYTFTNLDDLKRSKKAKTAVGAFNCEYAEGDGGRGTMGNPSNHFPSVRIKMHELQSQETNPLIWYRIESTNY